MGDRAREREWSETRAQLDRLTPREREVLELVIPTNNVFSGVLSHFMFFLIILEKTERFCFIFLCLSVLFHFLFLHFVSFFFVVSFFFFVNKTFEKWGP